MDPTIPNRTVVFWLAGLTTTMVVAGALLLGVGRPAPSEVDQLPGSPVRGMSDPDASALPEGAGAARPVLQVATGAADGPTGALPGSTAAAPPSVTPSTAVASSDSPASSVMLVPPTSAPSPGAPSTAIVPPVSTTIPDAGDPSTSQPATPGPSSTITSAPGGDELNATEVELARLTNELRTNPNGALRREGPVIDCDGRVPVDPATGLYQPVAPLTIDSTASLLVARDWSGQLTTNLEHRPQAGIAALQAAGIDVAAAGENIAYHNFQDKASRHFLGWRESDGHFCNMMDPTFTHFGIGEITRSDGFSFATQNFFSLR